MRDVAKVVKRRLSEGLYDFDSTNSYDDVDDIINRRDEERRRNEFAEKYEIVDKMPIEGFRRVVNKNTGKENYIDSKGRFISRNWYDRCYPFNKEGYAKVRTTKVRTNNFGERYTYNLMNKDGRILFGYWCEELHDLKDSDYVLVKINGSYNFIDLHERFLFNSWFKSKADALEAYYKHYEKL